MRYKLLGRSGLRVSELCLGTMTFGQQSAWGCSREDARRVVDAFADAGGNFIDTANDYMAGESERYLGELLRGRRDRFVLGTKYTISQRRDDPNGGGTHRKSMRQALDASLERLGTDHVDLYWVHYWDSLTPIDEVMRGLDDMVRAGKVLYVGISNVPAWVVARANTLADWKGWSPFVGLQIEYSLIERTAERDLIPMARELDLAVTAFGPIGAGVLTGKYGRSGERPKHSRFADDPAWGDLVLSERAFAIADEVEAVASELQCPMAHVALAWLRQRPGPVIPILGVRSVEQLHENMKCLEVQLGQEHIARLDKVSALPAGYPYDVLRIDGPLIYGDTRHLIDDHRA